MGLPRQKYREMVFQILFSEEFGSSPEEDLIALFMRQLLVTKKSVREAVEQARKVQRRIAELDQEISQVSIGFSLDRITPAERTILRLAAFELFFDKTVPNKV